MNPCIRSVFEKRVSLSSHYRDSESKGEVRYVPAAPGSVSARRLKVSALSIQDFFTLLDI